MVWVPQQLIGSPLGATVTIECWLEAHPAALHYWARPDGQVLHDPTKYRIESINGATAQQHLNNNSRSSFTVSSNGFTDKNTSRSSPSKRKIHSKPIDYCTCLFRIQRRSFPVFAAEPVVLHDTFETDHSPFDRQRLRTVSSTFSPFIPIKEFRFLPVFFNLILSTDTGVWQRILEEKRTAPSRFTVSVCILWRFFCQRGKMLKKV